MRWLFVAVGLLSACAPMPGLDASDTSPGADVADVSASDVSAQDTPADGAVSDASDFAQVASILRSHCSGYCHAGGVDVGASLMFEFPDGGLADLAQIMSRQVPRLRIVAPGDPSGSYLMIKVDNAMPTLPECVTDAGACGVAMPWTSTLPPAMLLPDADREVIRRWISSGAPRTGL